PVITPLTPQIEEFVSTYLLEPHKARTGVVEQWSKMPSGSLTGTMDRKEVVSASNDPLRRICLTGDTRIGEGVQRVCAFLMQYYSEGGQWGSLDEPANTITTKARLALVTVTIAGSPYVIVDIGLRMLRPRELYRAQGFPDYYII